MFWGWAAQKPSSAPERVLSFGMGTRLGAVRSGATSGVAFYKAGTQAVMREQVDLSQVSCGS